jgi:hypothetical protein
MSRGRRCKCQQKKSGGASFQGEIACPDCPRTNIQPDMPLQGLVKLSTISYGSTDGVDLTCCIPTMDGFRAYAQHFARFGSRKHVFTYHASIIAMMLVLSKL